MTGVRSRYEQGAEIRRAVLGDRYTSRALDGASEFAQPMQDLVTEYCWGEIWGNPDLDRRSRSLVNLALLSALNRQQELAAHARGAMTNGCTRAEVQAVLLQVAVYCGVPAGLEAFRTVEAALDEADLSSEPSTDGGDGTGRG